MPTTWNPSDKDANTTLSNTNHTATLTGGNSGARGTTFKSAGKWYLEYFYARGATSNGMIGFADATQSFTVTSYFNAIGMNSVGGLIGAGFTPSWGAPTSTGQNISVAIDLSSALYWWRFSGGTWNQGNGIAGTDPATGVGGVDYHATIAIGTSVAPFFAGQNATPQPSSILNAGDSAFSFAIPSGFTAWDAVVPITKNFGVIIS